MNMTMIFHVHSSFFFARSETLVLQGIIIFNSIIFLRCLLVSVSLALTRRIIAGMKIEGRKVISDSARTHAPSLFVERSLLLLLILTKVL